LLWLLPLLVLPAMVGCGAETPVQSHPVSGQVFYAGKPAAGVRVYFVPVSAPMMPDIPSNPRAVTDSEGRFKLSTFGNGDGAPEGGYQVVLLWLDEASNEEATPDRLLGWYDASRSMLSATIKAGNNELPAYKLPAVTGPPGQSEGIPGRN
jgi:hypothetical protein